MISIAVLLQPTLINSHDPGLVRRDSLDPTGWGQGQIDSSDKSKYVLKFISDNAQGYTVLSIAHTGGGS